MNSRCLCAMWAGILLLCLTWIFPPMSTRPRFPAEGFTSQQFAASRGPTFLFAGAHYNSDHVILEVETAKLVFLDAIIAGLTAGAMATLARRSSF